MSLIEWGINMNNEENKEYMDVENELEEIEKNEEIDEKTEKRLVFQADWPSIILRLAIILFICFVIIFIVTKIRKYREESDLKTNMETVRVSAYNYFKKEENRPSEITEEVVVPLTEMIDEKIIVNTKALKEDECDNDDSYVSMLKMSEEKYDLDVHLNCKKGEEANTYVVNYGKSGFNSENKNEDSSSTSDNMAKVLYEQKRKVKEEDTYVCPDGYTLVNHKCYSNTTVLSVEAIPKETSSKREIAADYVHEQIFYENQEPKIVSKSQVSCQNGKLENGKCKVTKAPSNTYQEIYSCPNGGTLNGDKCVTSATPTTVEAQYKCSSGTLVNDKCLITKSSKETCKTGKYDSIKKMCYTTYEATTTYSEWEFAYYVTFSKKTPPTNSNTALYVRYEELENGTVKYKKFKRNKISNNCNSNDVYQNGKCRHYNSNDKKYTCPDGYTLTSSNECTKQVAAKLVSRAKLSCPSGYKLYGNRCLLIKDAKSQKVTKKTCPTGYTLTSNICVKYENSIIKENEKSYTCPSGYELMNKNNKMYCTKKNVIKGYYYCSDDSYTLNGNKCVKNDDTQSYSCPKGYSLSGSMCYKHTKEEVTKATLIRGATNEEYTWSEEKKLDGWIWTGQTKEA